MAKEKHLEILKKGVAAWNEWRRANPAVVPDLSEALLSRANLSGADLRNANLFGTKMVRARLYEAKLDGANLERADLERAMVVQSRVCRAQLNWTNLSGTNLFGANLRKASLRGAELFQASLREASLVETDLSNARLPWTNLWKADLGNANFTGTELSGTIFAENDLSSVKGLETVRHSGPSTIGIDTIYKSKGQIPERFLRGAGVPEDFITYMKSVAGTDSAFEFYSCFISYSTRDQAFADRLHADLQAKGVRCWFAPHDVKAGRKLHEQIDEAIRLYERLLLILSPSSMNSEWVKTEIAKARKRENRERRKVLFPIRLVSFEALQAWECFDADLGKDSACEIREYFIPDFSNWKEHDSYQRAFRRLVSDLQAENPTPAS